MSELLVPKGYNLANPPIPKPKAPPTKEEIRQNAIIAVLQDLSQEGLEFEQLVEILALFYDDTYQAGRNQGQKEHYDEW